MENHTFKSVTFGGFAKQDVINYIEQTSREAAAVQEKLQQENDGLRAEVETLTDRLETLRSQIEEMTLQKQGLQAELDREAAARQGMEPLKPQVEALERDVERLRPDAEAYAQFRERIGAIECEARKRAADLEASTMATLQKVVDTFRTQYQSLMTTFDATAGYVTGELRKVEVNLAQLPRAMDRSGVELKELEAALARVKDKEEL